MDPAEVRREVTVAQNSGKDPLRRGRQPNASTSRQYRLIERGRERERRRIATELHDGVLQILIGVKLDLEASLMSLAPDSVRQDSMVKILSRAVDDLRECAAELRSLTLDLDPPYLASAESMEALQRCVDAFSERHPELEVVSRLEPLDQPLTPTQTRGFFRILQEALSNVRRHSMATRVEVELQRSEDNVILSISDNGHGMSRGMGQPDRSHEHFGLQNMRSRAAALGGVLSIHSSTSGVTVKVRAPLDPGAKATEAEPD